MAKPRRKLFAQLSYRAEKKGLDRSLRDLENLCDFLGVEVVIVAHDKDGALLGRHFLERPGDMFLNQRSLCASGWIFDMEAASQQAGLGFDILELLQSLLRLDALFAQGIDRGVDRDLIKSGTHLGVSPEVFKGAEDPNKHLLRNVFGIIMVSHEVIGQEIYFLLVALDKLLKG